MLIEKMGVGRPVRDVVDGAFKKMRDMRAEVVFKKNAKGGGVMWFKAP